MDDGSRTEKPAPTIEEVTASRKEIAIERIGFFENAINDYSEQLSTETDPEEKAILESNIETMKKKLGESRALLGEAVTSIITDRDNITPEAIINSTPSDDAKNADA